MALTEAEKEQIFNEFRRKIDEEAFQKREELKRQKHNLTQVLICLTDMRWLPVFILTILLF